MFFPAIFAALFVWFVFLLFLVFALVQFGIFTLAFSRLGIPPEYLSRCFSWIVGSMINIPSEKSNCGARRKNGRP